MLRPSSATNTIVEYDASLQLNGGIALIGDVQLPIDGSAVDIIPHNSAPFVGGGLVASIEVSNPTPILLYFPSYGIVIPPFTSGISLPVNPAHTDVWVRAQPQGALINAQSLPIVIRLLTFQEAATSGAGTGTLVQSVLVDQLGRIISTPEGAAASLHGVNGLNTTGGYDAVNGDNPEYWPARSPNVWDSAGQALGVGETNILTYNLPNPAYRWRLMYFELTIDMPGAVLANSRYLYQVYDGPNVVLQYTAIPIDAGRYQGTTGPIVLPGVGIRGSIGSPLSLSIFADVAGATGRANVGLYVGV